MRILYEQFVKERKYLKGVSSKTLAWYEDSWRAFKPALEAQNSPSELSKADFLNQIASLRERASAISVNTWLGAVNAFLRWLDDEGRKPGILRIPLLKEEQKILNTFTADQVKRFISYQPKKWSERRTHAFTLLLLDTGIRLNEALCLRWDKVDFDNLVLTVNGKGDKQRIVPFSFECRKILFRWHKRHDFDLVFPTREGVKLGARNLLRDFKLLANKLEISGVRVSPHTLRRTFAVSYLRAGGNQFYLMKILGHTSLEMTNLYVKSLGIDDLKAVHNGLSLLSR